MIRQLPCVVNRSTSMVGSELKALTTSKRLSGSIDPSKRKYVTLQIKTSVSPMKGRNKKISYLTTKAVSKKPPCILKRHTPSCGFGKDLSQLCPENSAKKTNS